MAEVYFFEIYKLCYTKSVSAGGLDVLVLALLLVRHDGSAAQAVEVGLGHLLAIPVPVVAAAECRRILLDLGQVLMSLHAV